MNKFSLFEHADVGNRRWYQQQAVLLGLSVLANAAIFSGLRMSGLGYHWAPVLIAAAAVPCLVIARR